MNENSERLKRLTERIECIENQHLIVSNEIKEIRNEIRRLKVIEEQEIIESPVKNPEEFINEEPKKITINRVDSILQEKSPEYQVPATERYSNRKKESSSVSNELEKFIGENLINKIGIIITVIGVAIGAKYAIDHELISPLSRIILGYLFGLALLAIAYRLKKPYENYSAVLLSGSMAIVYFMTFAAYSFYHLMPQSVTFALMVIITVFTVLSALNYEKQIIAHFGLVGAYAVPFLLSDDSGNVSVLYTYMAIINIGILIIAFLKYWRPLYYSSFILTWLIYFSWFNDSDQNSENFGFAFGFLIVFFLIFYAAFIAHKLSKNKKFESEDIFLLLSNSFIFYGLGYAILLHHEPGSKLLGLYTICNAFIHFVVSVIIYKQKLADRNLLHLIFGLVLVFFTISIPVQLNGNWVTLLWAGEAALLFRIGRTNKESFYEILSYPIMILACISIIHDWGTGSYLRQPPEDIIPIFNVNFLTSILFVSAFGFINYTNQIKRNALSIRINNELANLFALVIPSIFLITLYFSFRMEIVSYFQQQLAHSEITRNVIGQAEPIHTVNMNILKFKAIWMINYSLLFLSLLSFFNIYKLKNQQLGFINLFFNALTICAFILISLITFGELRDIYIHPPVEQNYAIGFIYIGIRYISMVFTALLIFATYSYIKQDFLKKNFDTIHDIFLYITILWIASSELISWMEFEGSAQSYKLGLSIFWGVYSLILISLGIWKKKKHLRLGAILLFAGTLLKLFIYDISNMDTVPKTIIFVALGILLLIISFLYNKYRNIIAEDV